MTARASLVLGGLLLAAGCGGGGGSGGPGAIAFAGTLTISSASTAVACGTTTTVTFSATGADRNTLAIAGGDCLDFVNADTAHHQPQAIGTAAASCTELNGPSLANGAHYTTPPFTGGPKTCQWQDALNPIPTGGGGGY
jgi:hypothetical protein